MREAFRLADRSHQRRGVEGADARDRRQPSRRRRATRRLDDAERLARSRDAATWLRITRGRLLIGEFDKARRALDRAREAGAAKAALDELDSAIRERAGR